MYICTQITKTNKYYETLFTTQETAINICIYYFNLFFNAIIKNMKSINLSKEHYTYQNGNYGSIHLESNFFLDVEKETEKAIQFQMYGKLHWLPKSAFVGKDLGNNCIVFLIKPFFYNKIMTKF